jgi:hypothetical protein
VSRGFAPLAIALIAALALPGCAPLSARAEPGAIDTLDACPADSVGAVTLTSQALPINIPAALAAKGPLETVGTTARRLTFTFAPGSFRPDDTVLWSKLSLRTYGGTVQGWTRLDADGHELDAAPTSDGEATATSTTPSRTQRKAAARADHVTVSTGPGYITVIRGTTSDASVASALTLDVLILPGGIPVNESIVRISELWTPNGKPLAPDAIRIDLAPANHAPGYDLVEAATTLDYVLWQRRAGIACKGSAETRATLVDLESVRPPFWDLGVSAPNGPRTRWLALSNPAFGVFRAVFDSPTTATSFANWIRATHSTQAGRYHLGLFERNDTEPLRPLAPVDLAAPNTFQPFTSENSQSLRVGPLGEP